AAFPAAGRHPVLLGLNSLIYGVTLLLLDHGIANGCNPYIVGLLPMLPAVMVAGLSWRQAAVLLALANLFACLLLADRVEPHFLLQLVAGQVLVFILNNAVLNE